MKYTVDYFIKKFEAIPEEKWAVGTQNDGNGNHCAYGWCMLPSERDIDFMMRNGDETEEGLSLNSLFLSASIFHYSDYYEHFDKRAGGIASVNNGNHSHYQQPTPKQRILAALQDIKKQQAVTYADAVINNIEETKIKQLKDNT